MMSGWLGPVGRLLLAAVLLSGGTGNAWAQSAGFDPVAATEAYLASLPAEARAKSDAYYEGGYWLLLWHALYDLAIAGLLLCSGLSVRLRSLAERTLPWRWSSTAAYGLLYALLTVLLILPLTVYEQFIRERDYGLSTQSFDGWLREFAIGSGMGIVVTALLFVAVYAVIRRSPRRWWIWGTGVAVVFLTVSMTVAPVFVAPIFNEYRPLDPGPLRDTILSMARANGVPAEEVWQFDASRQHNRISAHVSGLFGTTRIALNDNLLNRGTPEEVASVMGHELGHFVLGHGPELIVSFGLVILGGLAFAHWGFHRVVVRWGQGWGVRGIDDPAGAPVLAALLTVWFFLMTPVTNSLIRLNEAEADIYGLNTAREPDGFAAIALKLGEYRKLDPAPWEEAVFFDHPSGRSRIAMAMRWKAENLKVPAEQAGPTGSPLNRQ